MDTRELQQIKQQFNIIGNHPLLNRGIEIAVQVAITELSVLITGESGSGKEHFPKIIHQYSPRKHKPYLVVNCGAIPEGTIDSELFGHEKGAFTDARAERKGYFEMADGGTLFLDEVGELPLSTQARLLRVLENGEYIRVGSSKVQKTNVRVVAATNRDLPKLIDEGRFREDLYYRLNVIGIRVPSLRERREDIPLLFRKFCVDYAERYGGLAIRLTPEAEEMLKSYYWRGNVRQLKNVADQISIMEKQREITPQVLAQYLPEYSLPSTLVPVQKNTEQSIPTQQLEMLTKMVLSLKQELDNLKQEIAHLTSNGQTAASAPTMIAGYPPVMDQDAEEATAEDVTGQDTSADTTLTLQDQEKELIIKTLRNNAGNRKKTASDLGLSERTLYRKIKAYGLG
jgi:DNA-binding NtrC family response regulator